MWSDEESILWFLAGATTVAVIVFAVDVLRRMLERRARYARYHDLNTEPMRLTRPVDLGESMGPDRSESIRIDAENSARLAALRPGYTATNPHARGSAESILWFATYHLVATQLVDAVDIDLSDPVEISADMPAITAADLHFWTYTSTQPQA